MMLPVLLALAASAPWVQLAQDPAGARRASAVRYVPETQSFFLWGFMNDDPNLLQEHPLQPTPEYDVVSFHPGQPRWQNHLPPSRPHPLAPIPRTYSGITTGSERTVLRWPTEDRPGVPRPDLNIVHDQAAWHPTLRSLVYFTGGATLAYHIADRRWRDLAPLSSPPPVVGGSLAYDPVNDQLVLFGGGHVVERAPDGHIAGYTGLWVYKAKDNEWRPWPLMTLPPPRMNTRMALDTRRQTLVLFGGHAQTHALADTWLFDLKSLAWRRSSASGPEARAGHFTVYDPHTGWTIIGGGYSTKDLTDMWAYDPQADRWLQLPGQVPTGFYLTADYDPSRRLILLVTSTRRPNDPSTCNTLYPVRTTYAYYLNNPQPTSTPSSNAPPPSPITQHPSPIVAVRFPNMWLALPSQATARTWGSATFDSARGRVLYWGGGHCGYEGNDVDSYDLASQTWLPSPTPAEFPERTWDHGVRLAGVTFSGAPWTDHGRKVYAFDPTTRRMIFVKPIRLTSGYDPEPLRLFPAKRTTAPDALVPPSSYTRYATWSWDPDSGQWDLLGPAPLGLDTLVTTKHGVMGVTVDWPSRLNDAGYQLPYSPVHPATDNAVYRFDPARRHWERLGQPPAPSPQNLYEMTALVYDSTRDQLLLHGAGLGRDETWAFDLPTRRWRHLDPRSPAPTASREAVYLPREDVLLLYGSALWAYKPGLNVWQRPDLPPIPNSRPTQNRALVYDPDRDLVLLVLAPSGNPATVHALRYRHGSARFVTSPPTAAR